jgi:uncharacterized protein YkwD
MLHRFAGLAALSLVLLLAACSSMPDVVQRQFKQPPDPRTVMPALEEKVFVLVEAEREKLNPSARPLMLDPQLSDIARARSEDMAAKKYLGKPENENTTSANILMARDQKFQGLLGENIAAQYYTKAGGVDAEGFAQKFVVTWLQSQSHKDNLSFTDYNRTGIGAAVNGDTVYITQLFSTDLGLGPYLGNQRKQEEMPDAATAKQSALHDKDNAKNAKMRGTIGVQPSGP